MLKTQKLKHSFIRAVAVSCLFGRSFTLNKMKNCMLKNFHVFLIFVYCVKYTRKKIRKETIRKKTEKNEHKMH